MSTAAVSSASFLGALRLPIQRSQSALAKDSAELGSGTVADIGLSLGAGTREFAALQQVRTRIDAITQTNSLVSTRLSATQSALDSILAAAQSLQSQAIGAGNTSSGAAALQATAKAGLSSILDALNTNVGGQYVFAGINTDVKPVQDYSASPPGAAAQSVAAAFSAGFGAAQSDPSVASIAPSAMQGFLDGPFNDLFDAS
jgi:flagellar hook-associated protein 3 FlgL